MDGARLAAGNPRVILGALRKGAPYCGTTVLFSRQISEVVESVNYAALCSPRLVALLSHKMRTHFTRRSSRHNQVMLR